MKNIISLLVFLVVALVSGQVFALNVVATIPDLAAISQAVGGDAVSVEALANPNEDPHHVDPRPNKIIALNKADALVMIGLELEDAWLKPLVKQARNAKIDVGGDGRLVTSDYVKLIDKPSGKIERSEGDIHPGGNPHFTFDPRAAAKIAVAMQKKFSSLDPENAATYKKNTRAFLKSLQGVMKKNYQRFMALPAEKRKVVSYHKSLGYLLDWLGIKELINVEPKPGIPPNPAHVARVLSTMKNDKTKVILQEKFYPRKTSKTIAELAGGEVVVIDAGTAFKPSGGQSYVEHIDDISDKIYAAVSK